ncbi:MAG: DUF3159 domain-containing protein [Actinomycetes bacterium]|jgi:hypothetical protein
MSSQRDHDDRAKILSALGGTRGLIDSGIPSVLFLVVFNFGHHLRTALIASIALSIVLTIMRVLKRESLQHALSGLFGIAICALFAGHSGKASAFYLPSIYKNIAFLILYATANLLRFPLLGLVIGPIIGENLEWRKNVARRKAYTNAGWLWVAMFALRIAIQYPLYRANKLNELGVANFFLGYPLYLIVLWGSWQIIRRTPSVKISSENEEA